MKKLIKVAALSISVLSLAAASTYAADLNLNIYGASAQGKFWGEYASEILLDTTTAGYKCASVAKLKGKKPLKDSDGKVIIPLTPSTEEDSNLGITVGTGCQNNAGDKVIIRYTSNKSVEGPRAVMNQDPQENDLCIDGNPTNDGLRWQASVTTTGTATSACLPVHVGASDVASESFTQTTRGTYNGLLEQAPYSESLDPKTIPGIKEIKTALQPLIVPFSFFANTDLKKTDTAATPIDNINRQQALLLMSGNVHTWSQFGAGYPDKMVTVCMRHAGSGTHATLDKAIMRGDRTLAEDINVGEFGVSPAILFYQSTGGVMECVQNNGGKDTAGNYFLSDTIAFGYADSDAQANSIDSSGVESPKYATVKRMKYNGGGEGMTSANKTAYGYSALKNEIINGSYEFWSTQWMYINKARTGDPQEIAAVNGLYDNMMSFAANKELPCNGSKNMGCYWVNANKLKVSKTKDTTVPYFIN